MGYIGNAPYQGVITGDNIQDASIDTTDLKDSAVTVGKLASTLDLSGKTVTLPAGVGGHASGTEANRPASPSVGTTYFNTDADTLQQYTSAGWKNIGGGVTTDTEANRPATPDVGTLFFNTTQDKLQQYTSSGWNDVGDRPFSLGAVTGTILESTATNLTLSGSGFGTSSVVVRFTAGSSNTDVITTPSSDTLMTVAVPSAIYSLSGGTTVLVSVIRSGASSGSVSKPVTALPTGGTITTVGSYRVHTFTSTGNFIIDTGHSISNVETLIIGGGGGGGGATRGGGGGAGGYRCSVVGENSGGGGLAEPRISSLSSGTYLVTVGVGGSSGAYDASNAAVAGSNGTNSSFNNIISIGGGGGGASDGVGAGRDPGDGGCGGGGWYVQAYGLGTTNQGYNGGANGSAPPYGGGGGGAGQAGRAYNDPTDPCGGGDGVQSSIDGTPTYRAGGGSSASHQTNSNYPGGLGGGGIGRNAVGTTVGISPSNGQQYTGSGGGASGNGGDGIVIIRYQL